jgi:drug/metabolite transporter (DMT)-like permease
VIAAYDAAMREHAATTPAIRPPVTPSEDQRLAELAVLLVTVFLAGNFIVVKAAIAVLPPIGLAAIRYSLAGLMLVAVLRIREGGVGLPRRDVLPVMMLGVVGFGVYQVLWATALQSITAGDSALLIASTPIFAALLAVAIGSDILTRRTLAGTIVSFGGVAVVVAGGEGLTLSTSLLGDLLTIAAAVCWGAYAAFGASVLRRYSPLRTTTWALGGGLVVLVPLGIVQLVQADWTRVGPSVAGAIVYSATLSSGISNVVIFHGVKLLGPARITAFQFLVPPIAVLLAAIVLGEPVRPPQVVGGLVILIGVAIARTRRFPRRRPATPSS